MDIQILLVFALVCAVSDLRTRLIPNTLMLCGFLWALLDRFVMAVNVCQAASSSGSVLSACSGAIVILADGLAGFLLPWILLGCLAALKMFGGADVKLLSVIGLQLGLKDCFLVMVYSLFTAAAISAVIVIRRHSLVVRLTYFYRYLVSVMAGNKLIAYRSGDEDQSAEFSFALPVLIALLTVLITKGTIEPNIIV